jgi:hypothetical protein
MHLILIATLFAAVHAVIDLEHFEKRVYSQNGEDGVLEKMFAAIGTTNKYYVEFGVENGNECNTRYLRERYGFSGLLMDGGHENSTINLRKEFITVDNILDLFATYNVPAEPDMVSIDIDFNDWHIWLTMGQKYKPRVVVMEHNAGLGQWADKVVQHDPKAKWDATNYFGASIAAMAKLGRYLGYTLVYVESFGVNAFFIRDDVLQSTGVVFKGMGNVKEVFRPANYGNRLLGGWGLDPHDRQFMSADELLMYQDWLNEPAKWTRLRCQLPSMWEMFQDCPRVPYQWVDHTNMLHKNTVLLEDDDELYLIGRTRHVDNGELVFGYVPISSLYMHYAWGLVERKTTDFQVLALHDGFTIKWRFGKGTVPKDAIGEAGMFAIRRREQSHLYIGAPAFSSFTIPGRIVVEMNRVYYSWEGVVKDVGEYLFLTVIQN